MMQLIPITVGITVTIIVAIALFSVFPTIISSFTCPAINTTTDSTAVQAWKTSCNTLQTQTTVVPVLIALAIVIAAIVIVARILA